MLILKMKRDEMLKTIAERKGYFTIRDICNLYNYIYTNTYDREKATQRISTLTDIGQAQYITGTDTPRKYQFISQHLTV